MNRSEMIERLENVLAVTNIDYIRAVTREVIAELKAEPLTVQQAFERAGYPVPEGAVLIYGCPVSMNAPNEWCDAWFYQYDDYPKVFSSGETRWCRQKYADEKFFDGRPNIANLPAIDCIDALPETVRAVLDQEVKS